jgi:hypothetical protein
MNFIIVSRIFRLLSVLLILAFLLPLNPTQVSAEGPYTIEGTVTTVGILPIEGVAVTFDEYTTDTDASGAYIFHDIPEGTNGSLAVNKTGYFLMDQYFCLSSQKTR